MTKYDHAQRHCHWTIIRDGRAKTYLPHANDVLQSSEYIRQHHTMARSSLLATRKKAKLFHCLLTLGAVDIRIAETVSEIQLWISPSNRTSGQEVALVIFGSGTCLVSKYLGRSSLSGHKERAKMKRITVYNYC